MAGLVGRHLTRLVDHMTGLVGLSAPAEHPFNPFDGVYRIGSMQGHPVGELSKHSWEGCASCRRCLYGLSQHSSKRDRLTDTAFNDTNSQPKNPYPLPPDSVYPYALHALKSFGHLQVLPVASDGGEPRRRLSPKALYDYEPYTQTTMNDQKRQQLEEAMGDLQEMTRLSANIVSAKNGNQRSLQELQEPRTIRGEFPGNRDRAMGAALVIEEDLEELGISCEREYVGTTEFGHHVDLHIAGGNEEGDT